MNESAARDHGVVRALETLGFSLNESRAYAALLARSPATGYEIGAHARIPRSAVYSVLRRLVAAGAARAIAGKPERFAATPPADVVQLLRKRFDASTHDLEQAARALEAQPAAPDAFTVHGYDRVMEEAERLVRGAKVQLVVSGWPRELGALAAQLERAHRRRVHVVVFSHAELPKLSGETFSYGLREAELETFWRHRLLVVADDKTTLIGATEMTDRDAAVVSETPAIAEVATSQVALDITLLTQRAGTDARAVMARMLGPRVGRLDSLLARRP